MASSPSQEAEILTSEEVAKLFKVSLCWVHMKCRKRCKDPLPAHHVGKYVRFKRSEVLAWFDSTLMKKKTAR